MEVVKENAEFIYQEEMEKTKSIYEKKAKQREQIKFNAEKQSYQKKVANQLINEHIKKMKQELEH